MKARVQLKYRTSPQQPEKMVEFEKLTGGIGFRYDKPKAVRHEGR